MDERVLFVDDDENILDAVERRLRKYFKVDTALGPMEGLKLIDSGSRYAVVASDFRMPEMNGIQFLAEVKIKSPDSVCVLLSGEADLDAEMTAVNDGIIFRSLTKPVKSETLIDILNAALEQYRLVISERELLEKTLSGSIKDPL